MYIHRKTVKATGTFRESILIIYGREGGNIEAPSWPLFTKGWVTAGETSRGWYF